MQLSCGGASDHGLPESWYDEWQNATAISKLIRIQIGFGPRTAAAGPTSWSGRWLILKSLPLCHPRLRRLNLAATDREQLAPQRHRRLLPFAGF